MSEEELTSTCDDDSTMIFPLPGPLQDIDLGENTMAEMITGAVTGFVNNQQDNIARDVNEMRRENSKDFNDVDAAVRDSTLATTSGINDATTLLTHRLQSIQVNQDDRFFDIARDIIENRQQINRAIAEIQLVGSNTAKDNEIAVLKNTIEGEKNTRYLSDKIDADGERTRGLINDLKYGDLNRELIERNSVLVEERFGRRWYRDQGQFASQFAALQQQVQAFNSQLQETRQGMVNFGTMAGVGQSSTSNNVR